MEKKEKSWDERHPNWNLCYYTYMDEFEGVSSLDEAASKCALRVLKRKLEDEIGFELSDEVFIAICFKVINLAPANIASRAVVASRTVPAPMMTSSSF